MKQTYKGSGIEGHVQGYNFFVVVLVISYVSDLRNDGACRVYVHYVYDHFI